MGGRRVNANMAAIYSIAGSEEGEYRLIAPKDGVGSCDSGLAPSEGDCLAAARYAMFGLNPDTKYKAGSWSSSPPGCSVLLGTYPSGAAWTVQYNRQNRNDWATVWKDYLHLYRSVCLRPEVRVW